MGWGFRGVVRIPRPDHSPAAFWGNRGQCAKASSVPSLEVSKAWGLGWGCSMGTVPGTTKQAVPMSLVGSVDSISVFLGLCDWLPMGSWVHTPVCHQQTSPTRPLLLTSVFGSTRAGPPAGVLAWRAEGQAGAPQDFLV